MKFSSINNPVLKDFYQRTFIPVKTWKIPSSHCHPDTGERIYYDVELWYDKKIYCNCMAGSYNKPCHHKKDKKAELIEEFDSIENAIIHFRNPF